MKKTGIFLLGIFGVMFASCEETIEPAKPQENPQEPILAVGDIESAKAGVLASNDLLALESYNSGGAMIPVMSLTKSDNLPEGAEISYKVELSATEDFAKTVALDATAGTTEATSTIFSVEAEKWNAAHIELFGRSVTPKTVYYRVPVFVNLDGSGFQYDSTDYYAAEGSLEETRMNPGYVIADGYVLKMSDGSEVPFVHSEYDVYDDPNFSVTFKVSEDALADVFTWMIAPADEQSGTEANWYGVLETADPSAMEGSLLLGGPAGEIYDAGGYILDVNMETLTYTMKAAYESLYTPGGSNGWGFGDNNMQIPTEDYENYNGFVYVNGEFKLTAGPNWNINWGIKKNQDDKSLLARDGDNIKIEPNGLYYLNVNLKDLTIHETEITRVGVIGDVNGWGTPDIEMTPNSDFNVWTATVDFPGGGGFKFRMNNDWAINFGGDSMDKLTPGGANLSAPDAGTYTVTLDLSKLPYSCKVEKK